MIKKKESNTVFIVSMVIALLLVAFSLFMSEGFASAANALFKFFTVDFGWLYMIVMFSFVVFCVILAFSRFGNVRLGKDEDRPEYSTFSWFAMLFSAGMGVGLVFWGVAEPLNHWLAPLAGNGAAGSEEAARFALNKAVFHWGLHPWANYAVLAMGIAYVHYRKDKEILVSTVLEPVIGEERAAGGLGKFIDILAVFATIGGVSTSFGMAALQFGAGLNYLWGVPINNWTYTIIIMIVTLAFMTSAITGLNKGIKWLSNINVIIAISLMAIALVIGPTRSILDNMLTSVGDYATYLVRDALQINSNNGFFGGWTVFYWAWWIAWAPFVAPFIARISRGRTIKEFILGVMLVPTLVGVMWFSIFGTIGFNTGTEVAGEAIAVTDTALFVVFNQYHLGTFLSLVSMILLGTFYVTSADSATFVLGMLTSNGTSNPSTLRKVIWGVVQASMALGLIVAGGKKALGMIQTSSIVSSFPFMVIMVLAMVALVKMLRREFPVKEN